MPRVSHKQIWPVVDVSAKEPLLSQFQATACEMANAILKCIEEQGFRATARAIQVRGSQALLPHANFCDEVAYRAAFAVSLKRKGLSGLLPFSERRVEIQLKSTTRRPVDTSFEVEALIHTPCSPVSESVKGYTDQEGHVPTDMHARVRDGAFRALSLR